MISTSVLLIFVLFIFGGIVHCTIVKTLTTSQSSYENGILVDRVFGSGRATSTDAPGLNGEINSPIDVAFDETSNYIYLTDQQGKGLIRKVGVTNDVVAPFRQSPYYSKTVFTEVNCDFCEFMAMGVSTLYVSSKADNIKALDVMSEFKDISTRSVVISGSLGGDTCALRTDDYLQTVSEVRKQPCSGDTEGLGTFARYNSITGIALKRSYGIEGYEDGRDQTLYIADQINNKIRQLDLLLLSSDNPFAMTTFASAVDNSALSLSLHGMDVFIDILYCCVAGGVYAYNITEGATSKTVYAGFITSFGNAQGTADGSLTSARFGIPNYVTIDGLGNLYLSDHYEDPITGNIIDSIRRISKSTQGYGGIVVTTMAGKAECDGQCFSSLSGPVDGAHATFNNQIGLAISREGDLMFVADTHDNIVRKIYCSDGYKFSFGKCI